jgi:hypothetical protein
MKAITYSPTRDELVKRALFISEYTKQGRMEASGRVIRYQVVIVVLAIIMWAMSSRLFTGIVTLMACQILLLIHSRGRPKKWLTQFVIQRNMEKMSHEELSGLLSERTIEMAETGLTVSSLNMTVKCNWEMLKMIAENMDGIYLSTNTGEIIVIPKRVLESEADYQYLRKKLMS